MILWHVRRLDKKSYLQESALWQFCNSYGYPRLPSINLTAPTALTITLPSLFWQLQNWQEIDIPRCLQLQREILENSLHILDPCYQQITSFHPLQCICLFLFFLIDIAVLRILHSDLLADFWAKTQQKELSPYSEKYSKKSDFPRNSPQWKSWFSGGAPTFPSIRPSFMHHISGTIHHLIIIFGTHV